jgi:hypothetical protein
MHYRVRGTSVAVLSKAALSWPELEFVSANAGSIAVLLQGEALDLTWASRGKKEAQRIVGEGPKIYFPAGEASTTFRLSIERGASANAGAVLCEIAAGKNGDQVLATESIELSSLPSERTTVERKINFVIPQDQGAGLQIRIRAPGASAGKIEDVVMQTSPPAGAGVNPQDKPAE